MCIAAVLLSQMVPVAVVTSSTLYCSAFLALCGHNCSDWQSHLACVAGIKGGREEGKKVEKRESPPPPLSLSWPTVTFFYQLTMFRGRLLVYFYFCFFNFCVEATLLNGSVTLGSLSVSLFSTAPTYILGEFSFGPNYLQCVMYRADFTI